MHALGWHSHGSNALGMTARQSRLSVLDAFAHEVGPENLYYCGMNCLTLSGRLGVCPISTLHFSPPSSRTVDSNETTSPQCDSLRLQACCDRGTAGGAGWL